MWRMSTNQALIFVAIVVVMVAVIVSMALVLERRPNHFFT